MSGSSDRPSFVVVHPDGRIEGDADSVLRLRESGHLFGQKFEHRNGQRFGQNVSHSAISEFLPEPLSARDLVAKSRRTDSRTDYDPHAVHRDFPDRWQTYIRANYRHLGHVQQVFGVSERTARKWWNGETGANGGHVAIAVNEHPVAAPRMLFAAE